MDAEQKDSTPGSTGLRELPARPTPLPSISKGSFERHTDGFTSGSSGPLDDALGIALSGTSASQRHRSASPAAHHATDISTSRQSPSSRHFGQTSASSLLASGSGSLASAMNFRGPSSSSLGVGTGTHSSTAQSPHPRSPSFAAQYATSSDHSRHSSGHGSSLTGASLGTSGGGFGTFDLGSAASSSGDPSQLGKPGGPIDSIRGSFSGSPHIGGGLGVPANAAGSGDSKTVRGAPLTLSQNASMTHLSSALSRTSLNDPTASRLVSPSSKASSTAGSSRGHGSAPDTADQAPALRFGSGALSQTSDLARIPLPGLQDNDNAGLPSTSLIPDARSDVSSTIPVSLPTTGPLSAADPRTQLYISNLPYRVRWQDVKDLFRRAGTVLRADVSLTPDNRSRGIGTVLMASEDDARRACDMFRGFNWQGRTLDVKIDRSGTILGVSNLTAPGMLGVPTASLPGSPSVASRGSPMPSPLGAMGIADSSTVADQSTFAPVVSPMAQQPDLPRQTSFPSSQRLPPAAGQAQIASVSPSLVGNAPRAPTVLPNLHAEATLASARARGTAPAPQAQLGYHYNPSAPPYNANAMGGNVYPSNGNFGAGPGMRGGAAPYGGTPMRPPQMFPPFGLPQPQGLGSLGYVNAPEHRAMNPGVNGFMPSMRPNNAISSLQPPAFPPVSTVSHAYYGRVLFVGNLPFHCQWQDLKDLFRAAGNIQRADVALSPDGKSRGFGTVLFATPEDARNAVRIYHGYEYSGRTLKVHFDRFAQTTVPQPNALPASPSQYTSAFAAANTPTHAAGSAPGGQGTGPGDGQHGATSMLSSQQRPQHETSSHLPHSLLPQQTESYMQARGTSLPPKPLVTGFEGLRLSDSRRGSGVQDSLGLSATDATPHKSDAVRLDSFGLRSSQDPQGSLAKRFTTGASANVAEDTTRTPQMGQQAHFYGNGLGARGNRPSLDDGSGFGSASGAHPGRIALPPQGFVPPTHTGIAPFSPIQSRMSVPMTPGMPGFHFHGVPQTPPIHQHMFSPGLGGLLSPGIGSPTYGVGTPGIGFGSLINPAPGAPVHYNNGTTTPMASMLSMATAPGFNPMFPPIGMPYQPGAYQDRFGAPGQSALPQTPHWSQPRPPPSHQYIGSRQTQEQGEGNAVGAPERPQTVGEEDEGVSSVGKAPVDSKEQRIASAGVSAGQTSTSSGAEGYPFPAVGEEAAESTSAPLQRRNSTNTPLMSPTAPNGPAGLAVRSPGWEQRRGSSSGVFAASAVPATSKAPVSFEALGLHDIHVSAGATTTEELARKIAQMSAEKSLRQQQQRADSTSAEKTGVSRALAAPLELSLGKAGSPAKNGASTTAKLTGSALDDEASSSGSHSADASHQRQQGSL